MPTKRFCDKCGKETQFSVGCTSVRDETILQPCFNVRVVLGSCSINKVWCKDCCDAVMPDETYAKQYPSREAEKTLSEKLEEIIREIVREEIPTQEV